MAAYGGFDLEKTLTLPLSTLRKLCRRITARDMRRVQLEATATRFATNAEGKDFQRFMNSLPIHVEEEDEIEEGEFTSPKKASQLEELSTSGFEIRHE